MLISIPPKFAVSQVVGFIKGKSAIHLARVYGERKRNLVEQHFRARGYSRRCSAFVFARALLAHGEPSPLEAQVTLARPDVYTVRHFEKAAGRSWIA